MTGTRRCFLYFPMFPMPFTVKIKKNGTLKNNNRNCLTIGTVGFYSAVLRSKDAGRITNRVDPDQTAPYGAV